MAKSKRAMLTAGVIAYMATIVMAQAGSTPGKPTPAPGAGEAKQTTSPGMPTVSGKIPTDVRRTTILVRNMENSLQFYSDVLGLQVNYDEMVTMSGVALPAGESGATARLVLLNGKDPFIGWIGLLEWVDPPLDTSKPYPKRMGVGGVVLVLNIDDVDRRCALAKKVPGVTMTAEPSDAVYPGRNGAPGIKVRGCNVFDPDGILVEMNQLQPVN